MGVIVQEEGGVLQLGRRVDGRTERSGEEGELQLVDGAGGEGR